MAPMVGRDGGRADGAPVVWAAPHLEEYVENLR